MLNNRIIAEFSRIESSPDVTVHYYNGRAGWRYIPRTELAMDYCFYFKPNQHRPLAVNFFNVVRVKISIDKFLSRIDYLGDIPPDLQPNVLGCCSCKIPEDIALYHQNHCTRRTYIRGTYNQDNCDDIFVRP